MLADLEFECCYDRRDNPECPLDHSNSITSYIYTANNVGDFAVTRICDCCDIILRTS